MNTSDNALTSHGSLACPVCLDLWPEMQTDDASVAHLITHSPRELAVALLAADARRVMTRLALGEHTAPADRYELHLSELIADRRPHLTADPDA